jgi:hypothetical protein
LEKCFARGKFLDYRLKEKTLTLCELHELHKNKIKFLKENKLSGKLRNRTVSDLKGLRRLSTDFLARCPSGLHSMFMNSSNNQQKYR